MADFKHWKQENLVKFAFEASQLIADKETEIRGLKSDLKSCMDAYRKLNATIKEETGSYRSARYSVADDSQKQSG